MRLRPFETKAIIETIQTQDPLAEIWLYGSRANDSLRGGDIDLLVVSSKLGFSEKITLLTQIKTRIGDQKIDLSIKKPVEKLTDPWLISILPKAMRLN